MSYELDRQSLSRSPRKVACDVIFVLATMIIAAAMGVPSRAAPRILAPAITPAAVVEGIPSQIRLAVLIAPERDDQLIPSSVNVVEYSENGRPIRRMAILSDNGLEPDTLAQDHVYTGSFTLPASPVGQHRFQVTAALRGQLRRLSSPDVIISVLPATVPTAIAPPALDQHYVSESGTSPVICDEALVKIKGSLTLAETKTLVESLGLRIVGWSAYSQVFQVRPPSPLCTIQSTKAIVELLRAQSFVVEAEFHAVAEHLAENTGDVSLQLIQAPEAWTIVRSGASIGVIDTGVRYTHQDLAENIVRGWDFCGSKPPDACVLDIDPQDSQGHGTKVAGVAAAIGGNNLDLAGVAFNAPIIVEKVFPDLPDDKSQTWGAIDSHIAAGILDAVLRGARVINLSLGSDMPLGLTRDAIVYAIDRGCVVVTAAGNDGIEGSRYPAKYGDAIVVGASDLAGARAIWDDGRGGGLCPAISPAAPRVWASNYGASVDLYAPGVDLSVLNYDVDEGFTSICAGGTSLATPQVAGAASLMLSLNPFLSHEQVKNILIATAQPTGHDDGSSARRPIQLLDVAAGVAAALGTPIKGVTLEVSAVLDGTPWLDDVTLGFSRNIVRDDGVVVGGTSGANGTAPVLVEQPDIVRMESIASQGVLPGTNAIYLGAQPASVVSSGPGLLPIKLVFSTTRPAISVDGQNSDWTSIPPMIADRVGDSTGSGEIGRVWTFNDETHLYFLLEVLANGSASDVEFRVLLDNTNFPLPPTFCGPPGEGVDINLQIAIKPFGADPVYQLLDSPCSGGASLASGIVGARVGNFIEFSIPLSDVNLGFQGFNDRFRYWVETNGDTASTDFLPGWISTMTYYLR